MRVMKRNPRRQLRRGVVILPSAFTIGNLFLGMWAIVHAARGEFATAGWLVVGAAVLDMLDGRIARFTATGSPFGEELDSLVDAVSFGVAPALLAYFAFFREGEWGWMLSFLYVVAAILRLARFNIEQAGKAKVNFHGLPSPTAGSCVATYFAFTQTPVWSELLPGLPPARGAAFLVLLCAGLMVSNVLYPVVPRFSMRTWSGRFAILLAIATLVFTFTVPQYFFFPFAILYITYGLARSVLLGFEERLDEDPLHGEVEEEPEDEDRRELEYEQIRAPRAAPPGADLSEERT